MAHLLAGLVLSLAIGLSLGLLGGGGSIFTLPILVYVLGLGARQAIATSLLVVGITSLAALIPHARAGRVVFRVGLTFGAASMAGAFVGGRLGHFLPPGVLLVSFALVMLATGLAMLRGRGEATGAAPQGPGRTLAVGLAVGLLTGLVGAGGGFVIVPALALLMGLPMPRAVATSLFVIAMNSLAGFAGQAGSVTIDAGLTALVTTAAVAGSIAGARLTSLVRPELLRRGFAWLVLAMAVFMLARQASLIAGAVALVVALLGAWLLRPGASRYAAAH